MFMHIHSNRTNKQEQLDRYREKIMIRLDELLEHENEINIIYLRVSTQDRQEEEQQLPEIIKEFNLDVGKCLIIRSRESAFNMKKDNTRIFNIIKEIIFSEEYEAYKKNIFVWNLNRIYRNRVKLVDFCLKIKERETSVFSVRQKVLSDCLKYDGMVRDLMYYAMLQMYGQSAQDESENKSADVKKSMRWLNGRPFSRTGKMLGRRFRDLDGKKIKMTPQQKDALEMSLIKLITKGKSYSQIKTLFAEKKRIILTSSYLSSITKKYIKGDDCVKNYEELSNRYNSRDK